MNLVPPALHQIQQLTPRQNHVVETKEDKARPSLPTSAVVNLDLCVQYVALISYVRNYHMNTSVHLQEVGDCC